MAGKRKKEVVEKSSLVKALEFLHLASGSSDQAMYSMMANHYAMQFNNIIAAGIMIDEELIACPETGTFLEALERCGHSYQITQLSPRKLLVRSAEFQAYIPCSDPQTLLWPVPDAPIAPVNDDLITALKKVAGIVSPKAETVLESSIQLNAGSVLATNRTLILEAWHGNDLPSGLLLPKECAIALHKSGKHLSQFGYSKATATFYFTDGSWIRTQLFQEKPTNIRILLEGPTNFREVPTDLFKAAKTVAPFSTTGCVFIKDGYISSHPFTSKEEGSALTLPIGTLQHLERTYNLKNLHLISSWAEQWDETAREDGTMFLGDKVRGLIAHGPISSESSETDIPF